MVERARSWKHVKRVREVMQRKVVTIAPEASLLLAARRMREHQIGCLPVLERGELLGMITDRDLVSGLSRKPASSRICACAMSCPRAWFLVRPTRASRRSNT
jgi:CBS domain-containing protein